MSPLTVVYVLSIVAPLIFFYLKNKHTARIRRRRERLWQLQQRTLETLRLGKKWLAEQNEINQARGK